VELVDVSNTVTECSTPGFMLIILVVTMGLGRSVLLPRMLCCISSRLMCISTARASLAVAHNQLKSIKRNRVLDLLSYENHLAIMSTY
jgi:hypothetical protein